VSPRRVFVSPAGVVHAASGRSRWGRPVTACGLLFDRGWGRAVNRDIGCSNCRAALVRRAPSGGGEAKTRPTA